MSFLNAVHTGAELVRGVAGVVRAGRTFADLDEPHSPQARPARPLAIPGPVFMQTSEDVNKAYGDALGLSPNQVFENVVENRARKSLEDSGLMTMQQQLADMQWNQKLEAIRQQVRAQERTRTMMFGFASFAVGAGLMWLWVRGTAFLPRGSTERSRNLRSRRRRK